jgi:phage terminase large subunit
MKVEIAFPARPYQRELCEFYRKGGKRAYCVWHRKAGKDRTATFIESELAIEQVGLYWHALPNYEDARKVIWDAITPTGERLIDVNFPAGMVKRRLDHDMKLELVNGSIWQPVGVDRFNALVGAFPKHITYSEFPLMNPKARDYLRPALAMNDGTELVIGTPRGYNHGHDLWMYAKSRAEWFTSLKTVDDTKVMSAEALAEEKRSMPDELFRQEYYCDWSAANVGSVLGRYVEQAETENRITSFDPDDHPIEISSDIGYYDTAAWWFWQPRHGGFDLIDYDEDIQLDAEGWIDRLRHLITDKGYRLGKIWLPFDARAKTFQSRHSVVEQFLEAFGSKVVEIVPQVKVAHRINAARTVIKACRFHVERCKEGLKGLRAWQFEWDDEKKLMSKEPLHDWASHPGDAFSYGAEIMIERALPTKKPDQMRGIGVGYPSVSLNELWKTVPKPNVRI